MEPSRLPTPLGRVANARRAPANLARVPSVLLRAATPKGPAKRTKTSRTTAGIGPTKVGMARRRLGGMPPGGTGAAAAAGPRTAGGARATAGSRARSGRARAAMAMGPWGRLHRRRRTPPCRRPSAACPGARSPGTPTSSPRRQFARCRTRASSGRSAGSARSWSASPRGRSIPSSTAEAPSLRSCFKSDSGLRRMAATTRPTHLCDASTPRSHPFGCCISRSRVCWSPSTTAACTPCSATPCRSGRRSAWRGRCAWTSSRLRGSGLRTASSRTGFVACSWRSRAAATPSTPSAGSRTPHTQRLRNSASRSPSRPPASRSRCCRCSWCTRCFAPSSAACSLHAGPCCASWPLCCATPCGGPSPRSGCCCSTSWSFRGPPAGRAPALRSRSTTRWRPW
mmetsp:Transcript_86481/g.220405  ORF Transcript_86481/g.220405 Transcript_86481/m.220405 type:complete len:397 (-) Transcript_86481:301-1491(-)